MIVAKILAINKVAATSYGKARQKKRCSRNVEHNCPILTDTQFSYSRKTLMIDFGTSTPFFFDARKEWQYYGGGLRKRGFGTSLKRAKAMWSYS